MVTTTVGRRSTDRPFTKAGIVSLQRMSTVYPIRLMPGPGTCQRQVAKPPPIKGGQQRS
jgi:hypothetical protein